MLMHANIIVFLYSALPSTTVSAGGVEWFDAAHCPDGGILR